MGGNAATKLLKVIDNTERIIAIELFNAAQALEFRRPAKTSPYLEEFVAQYREIVPFIEEDVIMYFMVIAKLLLMDWRIMLKIKDYLKL
jgi:histidine ammonia-lyase